MFGETKASGGTRVIDKYLKWGGADWTTTYWDWEEKVNKAFNLKQFVVIDIEYAVQGFHPTHNCRIYSNKIKQFSEEVFKVRAGDHLIYEGYYKDLKETIKKEKLASLHIVVTALDDSGEVVQIPFKGTGFAAFLEAQESINTNTNKIKLTGSKTDKAGAVTYHIPTFEEGDKISDEEIEGAKAVVETIKENAKGAVAEKFEDLGSEAEDIFK